MKIEDVLNAYPSRLGEAEVADSDKLRDLREWAESAASTLRDAANEITAVMSTLDELGVPRNAGPGNPVSVGQPFGLESRLVQLRTKLAETEVDRDNLKEEATRAYQQRNEAAAERDQLRRMHDGVSADLDRERREHQETMAEAAARELKLTEERDALQREIEHSDRRGGDLERQLNHFVAQRDAEVEALRVGFMKELEAARCVRDEAMQQRGVFMEQRDKAIRDAEFFKGEAEAAVRAITKAHTAKIHERLALPKRRSKPKTTKKPKVAAKKSSRRKP